MGTSKIRHCLKHLWIDDRGQSTTEYILILAVVVMVAMKFKTTFQGRLGNILNTLGQNLDQAVQQDPSQ